MAITTAKKLPGLLAFQRGHVVSDALMFSRMADGSEKPVPVIRHGIRGTQNINEGAGNENPTRDIPNIQQTESAKVDVEAEALIVRFSLSMLDMGDALHSCSAADKAEGRNMRSSVEDFIERAKQSDGLYNVALRYARNIANGRWLWRNRQLASSIDIAVTRRNGDAVATFNALALPLNKFDSPTEQEHALAKELANQMRGESVDGLTVTATLGLRIGGSVEVFPSQNYAEKVDGFSRPLYKIGHAEPLTYGIMQDTRRMGQAALRDQKIFNAIRTIDTWYPDFADMGLPISVEPLGASLAHQEFYRKGKQSAFELFKRLVQIDPNSDEGMFCIASLDRGGVYGETDKAVKAQNAKAAKDAQVDAAANEATDVENTEAA
jgi:CRISPR-associated protein Csy3